MIRIKSKTAGFRRCGMAHPAEAVEYPDDKFTPQQISILKAEPMLIVEVIRAKAADDIGDMTVDKLKEAILAIDPKADFKGMRKDDLVALLKTHRKAAGNQG